MADTAEITEVPVEVVEATTNFFSGNSPAKEVIAAVENPEVEEKPVIIEEKKSEEVVVEEKPTVNTATPEPIKFKNEESEKAYNLLLDGKIDEVREILNEQKKLSEVDKLSPADVIKLNLQYQHKDYSQKEVEDAFNDLYELPKTPEQKLTESDEEFEERKAEYDEKVKKIESRIARDAKPATAELLKLQKEIVLPNIKAEPIAQEPTQEELDAQKANTEKFLKSVDSELGKFNGYETTFKDEEVEIKVAYRPTNEEKIELQPLIALAGSNAGEFLTKIGWLDTKGELNVSKIAEDLPLVLDKSKVLQKIASETGEKRHAASVKAIKNIDYSGTQKTNGDLGATPQQKEEAMVTHFFRQ